MMLSCSIYPVTSRKRMRPIFSSCEKAKSRPAGSSPARQVSRARLSWKFALRKRFRTCETFLTLEDVYEADEVFCTGTMGELAGVTKVDDRVIGEGTIGPMTTRLSELYSQRTKTEGIRVVG